MCEQQATPAKRWITLAYFLLFADVNIHGNMLSWCLIKINVYLIREHINDYKYTLEVGLGEGVTKKRNKKSYTLHIDR
jgi:hypothetical protein